MVRPKLRAVSPSESSSRVANGGVIMFPDPHGAGYTLKMVNGQEFSFRSYAERSILLVCTHRLILSLPSGFLGYPRRRLSALRRFRSDAGLFLSSPHRCPA